LSLIAKANGQATMTRFQAPLRTWAIDAIIVLLLDWSFASIMPNDRVRLQRFHNANDPAIQAGVRLEASQIAARRGDLQEARRLLQAAVQIKPDYAEAWLGLAWLAQSRQERKALLRRVLALEPQHPKAQAEMARLQGRLAPPIANGGSHRTLVHRWILVLLILAAMVSVVAILVWGPVENSLAWLIPMPTPAPPPAPTFTPAQIAAQFAPELETTLASGDCDRALEIVAIMQSVDPSGADVQSWARNGRMQCGQALAKSGHVEAALAQFNQVLALAPGDEEARAWQQASQTYLAGQAALNQGQWDVAIRAFADTQAQMPNFGDVSTRLAEAYRYKGQAAMEQEDWGTAVEALFQAQEQAPDDMDVRQLLSLACRGQAQAAMAAEDWTTAVETLAQAHERLPDDGALAALLVTAYRQRGMIRWEKGALKDARADLEAALALNPGDAEAQTYLDKVMYELFPPKRIEIDISKQWFYAWEGDTLAYSFVTSTGLPGRDTATGHFRVLDKIPMAYSSIWRLQMPHWLGIYYVGNVENGIHALPIRPDGSVMWGGLLGQRASYGCVILSTEAARIIYDWADIGTPVDIHY
jgi:tetratricopeptide (TPR) repeat protein